MSQPDVPIERHSQIVQSIYRTQAHEHRRLAIIDGRPGERGHRYYGERCVWCGINYLDELMEPVEGCGPRPGEWSDRDWPLDKVDALLAEHRKKR